MADLFYINVVCFVADVPDAFIYYGVCVLLLPCLKHTRRRHQDIASSPTELTASPGNNEYI